jgi:hypothetical protein
MDDLARYYADQEKPLRSAQHVTGGIKPTLTRKQ